LPATGSIATVAAGAIAVPAAEAIAAASAALDPHAAVRPG
jgi:hypothetical protein